VLIGTKRISIYIQTQQEVRGCGCGCRCSSNFLACDLCWL